MLVECGVPTGLSGVLPSPTAGPTFQFNQIVKGYQMSKTNLDDCRLKRCAACKTFKHVCMFRILKKSRRIKSLRYYSYCRTCESHRCKKDYRKNKSKRYPPSKKPKQCASCKKTKKPSQFYKYPRSKSGLSSSCRSCRQLARRRIVIETRNSEPVRRGDGLKHCPKCNKDKPFDAFNCNRAHKDHLETYCRECNSHNKNPYRYIESRYGLTKEQYLAMLDKQGNKCALCRKKEDLFHLGRIARLSVDHYETEEGETVVRGLLCNRCNNKGIHGLEYLLKNDLLKKALRYLREKGSNHI